MPERNKSHLLIGRKSRFIPTYALVFSTEKSFNSTWIRKKKVIAKCRRHFVRTYIYNSSYLFKSLYFSLIFVITFFQKFFLFASIYQLSLKLLLLSQNRSKIDRIERSNKCIFGINIKKTIRTPTFPSIYLFMLIYVIYKSTSERASSTLSISRLLFTGSKRRKNRYRRNDISDRQIVVFHHLYDSVVFFLIFKV